MKVLTDDEASFLAHINNRFIFNEPPALCSDDEQVICADLFYRGLIAGSPCSLNGIHGLRAVPTVLGLLALRAHAALKSSTRVSAS